MVGGFNLDMKAKLYWFVLLITMVLFAFFLGWTIKGAVDKHLQTEKDDAFYETCLLANNLIDLNNLCSYTLEVITGTNRGENLTYLPCENVKP